MLMKRKSKYVDARKHTKNQENLDISMSERSGCSGLCTKIFVPKEGFLLALLLNHRCSTKKNMSMNPKSQHRDGGKPVCNRDQKPRDEMWRGNSAHS